MPYEVTEREAPSPSLSRVSCPNCGEETIQQRWWCEWSFEKQSWVSVEADTEYTDLYCTSCEDAIYDEMEETIE